jgi:hypothetical protein
VTTEKTLSEQWEILTQKLVKDFSLPMQLDIDRVLYMIGIQELGKPHEVFSKEDKVNLIHIATCCVLAPFGYYFFEYKDKEGWPFYRRIKDHLTLPEEEQHTLLKQAILSYFQNIEYLSP